MVKVDIGIEINKIDSQITEARKAGNRKLVSELRVKHKEFSVLRARGIETIKGDKKRARKDQEGPEVEPTETQSTFENSEN